MVMAAPERITIENKSWLGYVATFILHTYVAYTCSVTATEEEDAAISAGSGSTLKGESRGKTATASVSEADATTRNAAASAWSRLVGRIAAAFVILVAALLGG